MADKLVYNLTTIIVGWDEVYAKFGSNRIFQNVGAELTPKFTQLQVKLTKDLTALAERSYRSTVPIRSGTLRNVHFQNNISKISKSNPNGKVWIDGMEHRPPYAFNRKKPLPASNLADILETQSKRRSRASDAFPEFLSVSGKTSGWVEEAERQYAQVRSEYTSKLNITLDAFISQKEVEGTSVEGPIGTEFFRQQESVRAAQRKKLIGLPLISSLRIFE